ncbi:BadF/BadG/BcrA/BcrD ATPase family protein [Solibacillus daqui]|uniref:BadF/BadG/BcrA/BcrD ATPase family protein n=1 Tax=Solibacillus daqui TaxID=2912187 RepID=UPI00236719FD|nr:BadF/BadG/BcrA/BcrD ATPase family protein [Solibacillus daqui]
MLDAYWIGIDGGGTKTSAVIGDSNGQLLAVYYGQSGNLTAISIEQLVERIHHIIEHLLVKSNIELSSVNLIFAALAGADRQGEQQKIYEAFQHSPILKKLRVQSDVHAALASGTWSREGTLMIAGTGAILFGWHQNKSFRIGGWGYLLGDEGSGYHLGKLAIRSILQAQDQNVALRPFQKAILDFIKVKHPEELITTIYSSSNPVTVISSVSKIVINAYEEDDVAKTIISTVLEALLALVKSGYERMDIMKPLVLHGGLFSDESFYRDFVQIISSNYPKLIVKKPNVIGAVGAYILALLESDVFLDDERKQNIQRTWSQLEIK